MTTPILLNAEQHEQLKTQLTTLLASEYSIERQSAGKIEYMAAVLMGFTNHHQRNALLNEHSRTFRANQAAPLNVIHMVSKPGADLDPSSTLPRWPGNWLNDVNGELPAEFVAAMMQRGWFVNNDDGDYLDYEIEFTYLPESDENNRRSFNAQLTFDRTDNSLRIAIGDNWGDGFNEYFWFCSDGDTPFFTRQALIDKLSAALETPPSPDALRHTPQYNLYQFAQAFDGHPHQANDLIAELEQLQHALFTGTK